MRTETGFACALAATVIWSGNFVASRAVAFLIPPWQCNFWRWAVAFAVLLPFAWRDLAAEMPALRRHVRYLSLMGILGVTLMNTFIYKAGQTTESLNMALLTPTAPVVILLLSRIIYAEPITHRRLAGLITVLAGIVILVSRGDMQALASLRFAEGDFWALGTALCFGIYSFLMRRRPAELSPMAFNAATFALGLVFAAPFTMAEAWLNPLPRLSATVVFSVLYMGIGCSTLSFWLWTLAVDAIGPVRSGLVYYSLPVFSAAGAVLLLGESIYPAQIAGGALVIGGIFVATRMGAARTKQEENCDV
ncbi:MAG: DMT family transporter [Desulfovibrio sp.]|nr:DMT family transporter [Desulfovibrio sp.]